jgi:hypothetical protein
MKIIKRYVCTADLDNEPLLTPSRYSEFEDLHKKLVRTFPHAAGSLPDLPRKSFVCMSPANHPPGPPIQDPTPLARSNLVRY